LISSVHAEVPAQTLPSLKSIDSGSISINTNSATNTLNVNQTSNKGIISWNSFNLGSAATVNFNQPSSSASTLNKIYDLNPSQIFGKINANGNIILQNAAGIYFGTSSVLNVGSLTATTRTISDSDYLNGQFKFKGSGKDGSITNDGTIKAISDFIALLAPNILNQGLILAKQGTVALATGDQVTLNFQNNGFLSSISTTPSTVSTLIQNNKAIIAPGGQVILSATALTDLFSGVINQNGVVNTGSNSYRTVQQGGKIYLEATKVNFGNGSQTLANGQTNGGVIQIAARDVTIGDASAFSNAVLKNLALISSSGDVGGSISVIASGTINQNGVLSVGSNSNIFAKFAGKIYFEANKVNFGPGSSTLANGTASGGIIQVNAGSISVGAPTQDDTILSSSTLISSSGDAGGSITMIAREDLEIINVTFRANAQRGPPGNIALSANNNLIVSNSIIEATGVNHGGNILLGYDSLYYSLPLANFSSFDQNTYINASATSNNGVGGYVETSGKALNFKATLNIGSKGIWLLDPTDLIVDSTLAGTISDQLNSGTNVIQTATGSITVNSEITKNSGGDASLTLAANQNVTINADITSTSGILDLHITATNGSFSGSYNLALNGGTLYITQATDGTYSGVFSGSGNLEKSGLGTLILTNTNTYTGSTTISSGTLALTGSGTIETSSLVQVDGTLDISGVTTTVDSGNGANSSNGAKVKRLTGSGSVALGLNRLNITAANNDTFSGIISSSADDSAGLSIETGTQTLTNINTYQGSTQLLGSTARLNLTGSGTIGELSSVWFAAASGGIFDISGVTSGITITSVGGGASNSSIILGSKTLTLGGPGSDGVTNNTFNGVVSGTGNIVIDMYDSSGRCTDPSGCGSQIFSGINTYTGFTTISAGTLQLKNSGSIASSSVVNIDDAATLNFYNTTGSAVTQTLNAVNMTGTTSAITNSSGVVNLSVNNGATLAGSVTTNGNQYYSGLKVLGHSVTLTSNGSDITFDGTINDSSSGHNLIVSASAVTFGVVGDDKPINNLDVTGSAINLYGNVKTNGRQNYRGPITLYNSVSIWALLGPISFGSTIDNSSEGTTHNLIIKSEDWINFYGDIGSTKPINNLDVYAFTDIAIFASVIKLLVINIMKLR